MTTSEDESHDGIMSERTLAIAGRIYAELQTMIQSHGDEVIAELMPLIVSVLEELDLAFQECDDAVRALEELRDELAQSKQEIKRQRQLRELIEEEKASNEDALDAHRKRLSDQHEQLQNLNKSMNLNISAKKEYIESLEGRMVELEKDHRDLEKRHLNTVQQLVQIKKTVREQTLLLEQSPSTLYPASKTISRLKSLPPNLITESSFQDNSTLLTSTPIKTVVNKVPEEDAAKEYGKMEAEGDEVVGQLAFDEVQVMINDNYEEQGEDGKGVDDGERQDNFHAPSALQTDSDDDLEEFMAIHGPSSAKEAGQNLYEELQGLPCEVTSPTRHQALIEEASDLLDSGPPSRRSSVLSAADNEMQVLLRDKQSLEEIRNKLMKENNELMSRVKQSESSSESAVSKVTCLELENGNIMNKVRELEQRLRQLSLQQHTPLIAKPSAESVDPNLEKRFTRSEMDKVIREKNLYKEKYLELQEDLSTRYVEIQNEAPNEKSKFWNLFSGLFTRKRTVSEVSQAPDERKLKKIPDMKTEEPAKNKLSRSKSLMMSRHFIQGWSLPHDVAQQSLLDMDFIQSIPAPIYCGPLGSLDNERKCLVRCCATADDDDPLTTRYMTWVCCERDGQGEVFIVDPANPTEIKDSFIATKSSVICISYVPAADPLTEHEMVTIGCTSDTTKESDSDNDSGGFELYEGNSSASRQPSFWMGTQNGFVVIHSAVEEPRALLTRVRLKDSVLEIRYIKKQHTVLVGCADSSVVIFSTNTATSVGWDMSNYRVVPLGLTSTVAMPVSVISPVRNSVWMGYGGNIAVLSLPEMNVKEEHLFEEGERALVTHMVPVGHGVWVACRFNSVLTLLDTSTLQPLQQVNMEEVLRPVSLSYGFTTVIRVSAVLCYNNLLWVGTSQGALVTIPLKSLSPSNTAYVTEPPPATETSPMFAVRGEARISLHGHQGAVRYILVARYNDEKKHFNTITGDTGKRRNECTKVVLSGGEGYISYRDMDAGTLSTIRRGRIIRGFTDHCHMIAWDVSGPSTVVS